jgi:hypothetical protein
LFIAVINQSTLVTDEQAAMMAQAVDAQLTAHFATTWERTPPRAGFYASPVDIQPGSHGIAIVDTITGTPAGVLGYHTEDTAGQWGIVAAKPELDNGAAVLTGDWSVSTVLSHEALELAGDPSCSFWGAAGRRLYALELCDPVEAPSYEIDGVAVSNFVLPAWFDPQARPGSKFDHLGLLSGPFSLLPTGYVVYMAEGREHQKFGGQFPAWRAEMKTGPSARTARRRQLP